MLAKASVKKPLTVVVGIIIVIMLGVISVMNTGVDLLPGMNMPYMMVVTVYPGASPETVEKDVTTPIEKSISKVSSIKRMMSTSSEHVSIVSLELDSSANVDTVFQEITANLKLVSFPNNDLLKEPIVMKLNPSMLPIMSLSIGRDNHTIQDSGDYFNDIIDQINGIDGVAGVTSNGMVSNFAYVGLDPKKTAEYISNFLFDLFDMKVELPLETKEQIRIYLRDLIIEAENDPELAPGGKIDPSKLLDRIIYDIENSNVDLGDLGSMLTPILDELKNPDSLARKAAISALKDVLANKYILEDGEENKKIFYSLLDQVVSTGATGVANSFVGDLTSQISADVFKQLIFAQNFDMPAGSLPVGEAGYIVKVGDAIKNRDEFYNLPVFSISMTEFLQQYLKQLETILNIAGLVSEDGKMKFTDTDIKRVADAIAILTETVTDHATWAVDMLTQNANPEFVINKEAKEAWITLLKNNNGFMSLTSGFGKTPPTDWRSQTLNYIKSNQLYPIGQVIVSPAYWTDGTTNAAGEITPNFNAYYLDRVQPALDRITQTQPQESAGTPLERSYANRIAANLASHNLNMIWPIDVGVTAWSDTLVANADFVKLCKSFTKASDWEYQLINFIKETAKTDIANGGNGSSVLPVGKIMSLGANPILADDDRLWDINYTNVFMGATIPPFNINGVLGVKLKAIEDARPISTDYRGYAAFVATTLADTSTQSQYYLSSQAVDFWTDNLSKNVNFMAYVDTISADYNTNWQYSLLQNIIDDDTAYPGKYHFFPDGELVRPQQYWDTTTSAYYDTKVDSDIANTNVLMALANSIKVAIGDENYNSLLKLFAGKNSEQIQSDIKSMINLAAKISPNGVIITTDETGMNSYVIDFEKLNADLKANEERLKIPLKMNNLGDISFLDDSGKQISTIFTRDKNGNFVAGTSVSISIEKEPDKSTANITGDIKKLLAKIEKGDADFSYSILSDDGSFINQMLSSVVVNLLWGALFAAIVLFMFLKRIKPTLVVAFSIVTSVVIAFICMYFSGITLNIISMGGMTLAVGMLVDNSIVVLENIYRLKAQGKNIYAAAIQGAKQVSTAIVASTITTVVVFLPVIFINGMTKEIMRDMSLTITFALIASLISALTIVPVAASTILKEKAKPDGKFIKKMKKSYTKVLNFSLNNKIVVIPIVLVLFCSSLLVAFFMNREFMPAMDTGTVVVTCTINREKINEINASTDYLSEQYYTYQDAVNDTVKIVTESAKQYNDIETFGISYAAGMSLGGLNQGGDSSNVAITMLLKQKREMGFDEIQKDFAANLKNKTGGLFTFSLSTNSLLEMGGFTENAKEILIYGDDFDELREQTVLLTEKFKGIKGVTEANNGFVAANKEYKLTVDKNKANAMGLTVAQVFMQIQKYLTQPSVLETLKLANPDDLTNSKTDYVDILVYSNNYRVDTWYDGYANNTADIPTRIYFTNNLVNGGKDKSNNDYFVLNDSTESLIMRTTDSADAPIQIVEAGGKIPLHCDGDNYSYYRAVPRPKDITNADGTTTTITEVTYEKVSFTVRSYLQFSSIKQEPIDLLMLSIASENMLNPSAPKTYAPLFSILADSSFIKDENGEIRYRDVTTANGEKIPYGVNMKDGYSSISHYKSDRCITVKITYDSSVISDKKLSGELDKIIAEYNVTKPTAIRVSTEGISSAMTEVFTTLIIMLVIAIVLIYLIMVAQFQSLKSPFIIMFTIPLAFTGGILLLAATGQKLSVIALIGLIILMGVVVNNGIVFVDYANKLIESGVPKREAMLRTGIDRMRPILMTALTTIFATLTMALDNSSVGKMLQPLAITTIGGLTYATFLTLIFVPIMYEIFNKNAKPSNRTLAFRDAEIDKIYGSEIDDNLTEDVQSLIKMVENDTFKLGNVIKKGRHDNINQAEQIALEEGIICEEETIENATGTNGELPVETASLSPYERQKLKVQGLLASQDNESQTVKLIAQLELLDQLRTEITAEVVSAQANEILKRKTKQTVSENDMSESIADEDDFQKSATEKPTEIKSDTSTENIKKTPKDENLD